MAKYGKKAQDKVEQAMHEMKRGTLKTGSGKKVTSRKQAIAIGLSEAKKEGGKVPEKKPVGTGKSASKKSATNKRKTTSAKKSISTQKTASKRKTTNKKKDSEETSTPITKSHGRKTRNDAKANGTRPAIPRKDPGGKSAAGTTKPKRITR